MLSTLKKWSSLGLLGGVLALGACDVEPPIFGEGVSGQGSTLARFTIAGDELYLLDGAAVRHFDVSDPTTPIEGDRITVDFEVQSLFSYQDHLFMGNSDGLNVFSLANPDQPDFLREYSDLNACTPIGFQGDFAFVTRRMGNECGWAGESELSVLNVADFGNITTVRSYSGVGRISSPFAVAVAPNTLFVCEGPRGLRIFDTRNPQDLVQTGYTPSFEAYDVVPNGTVAIIKGSDGLYQYNISDPGNIRQISFIPYRD